MKPKYVVVGKCVYRGHDIAEAWYFNNLKDANKWIDEIRSLGYDPIWIENGETSEYVLD